MKPIKKTVFKQELAYKDWHYRLYLNGERTDKGIVPLRIWKKYLKAEDKISDLRVKIRIMITRKKNPSIKLWLAYYDAIKEFWLARTELEIYYYEHKFGAENPTAKQSL